MAPHYSLPGRLFYSVISSGLLVKVNKISAQDDLVWRHKGRVQLGALLDLAAGAVLKLRLLESEWPAVLQELVRDTLVDYSHLHAHMKKCMASLQSLQR